jgi:hypothetical protein
LVNFDCIGWDMDHTLVRYKLEPIADLIFRSLLRYLVEVVGYPEYAYNASLFLVIMMNNLSFYRLNIIMNFLEKD